MKLGGRCFGFGVAVALCLGGTGCVVTESVPVTGGYLGDIVLTWSIDGDSSGGQCGSHDAPQIQVTITDSSNQIIDSWRVPCASEGSDESLPPGVYSATAQLLNASGQAITTADPTTFTISSDSSSLPVDFDFDEDSFTNGT